MRVLTSILSLSASVGAALAAAPLEGPFYLTAVSSNSTDTWPLGVAVASRGVEYLDHVDGYDSQFSYDLTKKNIFPTGKPQSPNSALENGGLVLLGDPNLGEPVPPGPIEQYESDGNVYLIKPGVEDIYQWDITGQLTWYTPGQANINAAIRVDVNAP